MAGPRDRERLVRWYLEFAADVGEVPSEAAAARFADGRVTLWGNPDGMPVSLAGVTPVIAGHVRVTTVHTPAHLRGRGYAGAVTAEASRAASAAGARQVLLFTNLDNATANALYLRSVMFRSATSPGTTSRRNRCDEEAPGGVGPVPGQQQRVCGAAGGPRRRAGGRPRVSAVRRAGP